MIYLKFLILLLHFFNYSLYTNTHYFNYYSKTNKTYYNKYNQKKSYNKINI